jgi:formylglycine-generating enzyme required for sulfatase activity
MMLFYQRGNGREKLEISKNISLKYLYVVLFILLINCSEKTDKEIEGMVWIPGGSFYQGALDNDTLALLHEKPRHLVHIDGFYMDISPVTNKEFRDFVKETGYITTAERDVNWGELARQLPPGTDKPHDSLLKAGSLIFSKTKKPITDFSDFSQWWKWKIGANWKKPRGDNDISGKDNYPVVHISYEDALSYCKWADKRLPTEAEWEYAARANRDDAIYYWGNDHDSLKYKANTWEGQFPFENSKIDGYENLAPIKSFPANDFGLYGMSGNVWEWTSDWYNVNYYKDLLEDKAACHNPKGATHAFNPNNIYAQEKVIKGGSFLCNINYCISYRISAKMSSTPDTSLEHLGFRAVAAKNTIN